jgi:hypothetical protein
MPTDVIPNSILFRGKSAIPSYRHGLHAAFFAVGSYSLSELVDEVVIEVLSDNSPNIIFSEYFRIHRVTPIEKDRLILTQAGILNKKAIYV